MRRINPQTIERRAALQAAGISGIDRTKGDFRAGWRNYFHYLRCNDTESVVKIVGFGREREVYLANCASIIERRASVLVLNTPNKRAQ